MRNLISRSFGLLSLLGICSLGFIIYSNSFYNAFQFDDMFFIVDKPNIRDITNLKSIWQSHHHPARFVGFYTFALNYHFHQYHVFGYHLVNTAIHVMNGILVWWFVCLIFQTDRMREHPLAKYHVRLALLCGLLFVAHPIQTQAVTYISQRFASLATFFYLTSTCLYIKGRLGSSKGALWFFCGAGLSALLGMFTKQIVFTLPLAVLLIEFLFIRKDKVNWAIVTIIPLFLLIVPGIFGFDAMHILNIRHMSESHEGDKLTQIVYFLTQLRVLITYGRLLFFPFGQNLDYDYPASYSFLEPRVYVSFIVLLFVFITALTLIKRHRLLAFGILWVFLTLSVESSFITIKNVIFEHRLYLPMLGFSIFFVFTTFTLLSKKPKVAGAFVCCVIVFFSFLTYQRNKIWQTRFTMWQDVIKKSPNKSRPHISIAIAYIQQEKYDLALEHLEKAIEINPSTYKSYNNRGLVYAKLKQYERAVVEYTKSIQIQGKNPISYNNRGDAYRELNQNKLAYDDYNKAIELNPYYAQAYINRGVFWGKNKKYENALNDFNTAFKINPNLAEIFNNRGIVYQQSKMYTLAEQDFNKAIALKPHYADAYYNRGNIYKDLGQYAQALDDYAQALNIRNNYSQVYNNRGIIYGSKGENDRALEDFNQAIHLNPKYSSAYFNRSLVFMKRGEYNKALADTLTAQSLGKKIEQIYIQRIKSLIQQKQRNQL